MIPAEPQPQQVPVVVDPQQPTQSVPAVQPASPAAPAMPADRQAIIERYQQTYGVAPSQDPNSPQPPVQAQPVPVVPDLTATVTALQNEIAALKAAAPAAPQAQPQTPAQPEAPPQDWLKLLAEGKKTEGEAALRAALGVADPQVIIAQTLERVRAEQEVTSFVSALRADPNNVDVLRMEPFITAKVQARLGELQQAGKISRPSDYVTAYKQAVNDEVASARNLILTFRGEGRQLANTRQTQVLSAPMLQPNAVTQNHEQQQAPQEPVPQSAQDYMQARMAAGARMRGMA